MGGDGKDVRMLLPLKNLVFTYTKTGKSFNFNGHAVGELELHFIPHDGLTADANGGKPFKLVVKPTSNDPTAPVFTVITMTLDPVPGTVTGALIQEGLNDWANANLADFAHVFSVVNLNRMVDQGQWGFVTPNYTSYAYLDGGTLDTSIFGVLCMTANRTGGSLSEQINEASIPSGSIAGFLISATRTLADLVKPAIMLAYPGLTDSNFLMNDDKSELYLTKGTSVALPTVEHAGSTYQPYLTQLSVKSLGQIFTLVSYTETEIVSGITAWCQTTHQYTIGLGSGSNGQTLMFSEAAPASIIHGITQSPGSQLTQLIIMIVAAVALVILGILTGGAALVVGGLIIGLVMGADAMTPTLIKLVNKDNSPSIDLMLINSVDPIKWSDSKDFKLTYGSLNASLQLGGDPLFV